MKEGCLMTKNISEFRKKFATTLMLFITFLTLFTGKNVHAFNPEEDFTQYTKDYSSKHYYVGFKKADGKFTSNENLNFYKMDGLSSVPCQTYQEWLNAKQASKDAASFATIFVPFLRTILDVADAVGDVSGFNDKYINENKDPIGNMTNLVKLRLNEDSGKGFFFFDTS